MKCGGGLIVTEFSLRMRRLGLGCSQRGSRSRLAPEQIVTVIIVIEQGVEFGRGRSRCYRLRSVPPLAKPDFVVIIITRLVTKTVVIIITTKQGIALEVRLQVIKEKIQEKGASLTVSLIEGEGEF